MWSFTTTGLWDTSRLVCVIATCEHKLHNLEKKITIKKLILSVAPVFIVQWISNWSSYFPVFKFKSDHGAFFFSLNEKSANKPRRTGGTTSHIVLTTIAIFVLSRFILGIWQLWIGAVIVVWNQLSTKILQTIVFAFCMY